LHIIFYYLNATISVAVEPLFTDTNKPGIHPDIFFNVITDPSTVVATTLPNVPTNKPPAVNPIEPVPVKFTPPLNCGLVTYDF